VVLKIDECVRLVTRNLTDLGVNSRTRQIKGKEIERGKIPLHEVTAESLAEMDISELVSNLSDYEQEVTVRLSTGDLTL
jgi:hypothetical protein